MINFLQRWLWPLVILLLMVELALVWLSPTEQTLGQTVKLVYVHGALVRSAIMLFAIGIPVNLGGLVRLTENWLAWGKAVVWAAALIWLAHTLFSMITTYAAWGLFIAWYEPRTRFTFILAGVSLVIIGAAWFVDDARFTALVFAILGGLVLGLMPQLGVLQHPLDPIGTSTSDSIRLFYAAILIISMGLAGLLTLWLRGLILGKGQGRDYNGLRQMQ
jgi:hypothetical protein